MLKRPSLVLFVSPFNLMWVSPSNLRCRRYSTYQKPNNGGSNMVPTHNGLIMQIICGQFDQENKYFSWTEELISFNWKMMNPSCMWKHTTTCASWFTSFKVPVLKRMTSNLMGESDRSSARLNLWPPLCPMCVFLTESIACLDAFNLVSHTAPVKVNLFLKLDRIFN